MKKSIIQQNLLSAAKHANANRSGPALRPVANNHYYI